MPQQEHAELFRIQERCARSPAARARLVDPHMLSPSDAVRLVAGLAGGSLAYTDDSEPSVQADDLLAALRLLPLLPDSAGPQCAAGTPPRRRASAWAAAVSTAAARTAT